MNNIWDQFFEKRGRFYLLPHSAIKRIIEKFKLFKIRKVLDLGCGSGRHCILLAKEGFVVTGLDYSKKALDLARNWAENEDLDINLTKANFEKPLPYKDESFDAVIAIDSIHYSSTDTIRTVLKEMKRIVTEHGLIFITLPTTVGNPLITHLVFKKDEVEKFLKKDFQIIDSFMDEKKNYCVFAKVKKET